ncbi:isochorismatase [Naviculisporaceae sp. PSN 640]
MPALISDGLLVCSDQLTDPIRLSVCDIQEKFRNAIFEFDKVVLTSAKLLRFANALKIPIYVTTQNRAKLGDTVSELKAHLPTDLVKVDADKTRFSMYIPPISTTEFPFLTSATNGSREVAIVGIESHICVTQTALDLLAAGYRVYIIADGVSSCNRAEVPIALERLRQAGAVVTSSESWMYECMGDSGIEEFREVVKIVKDTMGDTKGVMEGLVGGYMGVVGEKAKI